MGELLIRLAYGIMIVGAILCFVFSKNHQRDLRKAANEFALAFVRLSNFVSPKPPSQKLKVRALPDGGVEALPLEEQPEPIRRLVGRAGEPTAVELFAQADAAADLVSRRSNFNRTQRAQFQQPIDQLLLLTQTFLRGCEDLRTINTEERLAAFESYLYEQPKHRMVLIKRITGDLADEYRSLNKRYAAEMERIEAEEAKARRRQAAKEEKAEQKAEQKAQEKPQEKSKEQEAKGKAKGETAKEQKTDPAQPAGQSAPDQPAQSSAEDWHGWGCG